MTVVYSHRSPISNFITLANRHSFPFSLYGNCHAIYPTIRHPRTHSQQLGQHQFLDVHFPEIGLKSWIIDIDPVFQWNISCRKVRKPRNLKYIPYEAQYCAQLRFACDRYPVQIFTHIFVTDSYSYIHSHTISLSFLQPRIYITDTYL